MTAAPYGAARNGHERQIAVAIHDVEPATFERCALIRDWLDDHGIDRATLLVIPAPDLHPFFQRRPDLAAWLLDCRDRGDAIAQHGLKHRPEKEFARLDADATHASIEAGRRVLTLAGVEPRGFVAPAYAYTSVLKRELSAAFDWWATLLRHIGPDRASLAPALSLSRSSLGVRAGALASGPLLRLDLHPADFDRPRHVMALESVLARASRRTPVTYDDLC
jgi:peptidoglycan/xylan/chitin deacetylase (PgdA/CDA1 family)